MTLFPNPAPVETSHLCSMETASLADCTGGSSQFPDVPGAGAGFCFLVRMT